MMSRAGLPLATNNEYVTTTYGYDIANRLTSMLLQGPSVQIENLIYTYDQNGNRTNFTRNASQTLSPAMSNTNYDEANEMLAYNSKTLTYDNNGNLLTKVDSCGTTTYTWDARNRLTGISGYKSDCTALTAGFNYDALGRRISKTINGTTTQFVYDGWDIIQEIKAGVKTNYIRTLNIDEPLTRTNSTVTRQYVRDALGSVVALTDDTGTVKTAYVYDAFGNATVSGETTDNPFQFAGRENDGTGLLSERNRYYSFELQRYISEDPIRLRGGDENFFVRVGDNPVNRTDPLGLWTVGAGITINFQIGTVSVGVSSGVVIDGSGNIGTYVTGGGGLGVGAKISGGVSVSGSNAKTICDLSGPFTNGSLGGGWGASATGDYFTGNSDNGWVTGGGVTIGGGLGTGGSSTITGTTVTPIW